MQHGIQEGATMTNAEVIANVDNAMAKLQLLTSLFNGETDTNICHAGILYVINGIASDLGSIYEGLEATD